jgi:hypothetical protein
MVLLRNPGRANGGLFARPVKIDGTIMYDPLSDFAAWPNPFTLANNVMAGLLPTYILRGLTLDTIPDQLTTQIEAALANLGNGNPLALNLYLTLPSATLPVLEPLYLLSDLTSLATLGALSTNPFGMVARSSRSRRASTRCRSRSMSSIYWSRESRRSSSAAIRHRERPTRSGVCSNYSAGRSVSVTFWAESSTA